MKKVFILLAVITASVAATVATVYSNDTTDELLETNVEALADEEIIVGPQCAYNPATICESLGDVFYGFIRANE